MLPSHLAVTRDIFLFAVYTGMCYCDIQELTNDNITRGIDGNQWLQYYRKKTNQRVSLPLLQPAARILMQYATHKDTHQHLPIFQVPCNQVINRSLKQIATIAKVNKKITFHMARHNKNYIYLNMKWLRLKRNRLVNGLETSELLYSSSFCIKRKNFLTFAKVQNFTRFHEFPKTFFHSRFHSLVIFTPSESHFRLVA